MNTTPPSKMTSRQEQASETKNLQIFPHKRNITGFLSVRKQITKSMSEFIIFSVYQNSKSFLF